MHLERSVFGTQLRRSICWSMSTTLSQAGSRILRGLKIARGWLLLETDEKSEFDTFWGKQSRKRRMTLIMILLFAFDLSGLGINRLTKIIITFIWRSAGWTILKSSVKYLNVLSAIMLMILCYYTPTLSWCYHGLVLRRTLMDVLLCLGLLLSSSGTAAPQSGISLPTPK